MAELDPKPKFLEGRPFKENAVPLLIEDALSDMKPIGNNVLTSMT
jgi:hypothetical protein